MIKVMSARAHASQREPTGNSPSTLSLLPIVKAKCMSHLSISHHQTSIPTLP